MDAPVQYLSWNFILISVPNVLVIVGMIVVFVAALFAPFPGGRPGERASERTREPSGTGRPGDRHD